MNRNKQNIKKYYLGRTRAVFQTSPTGNAPLLVQETHYFSFGGEITELCYKNSTSTNKYLYNGKEKQTVGDDATFCMDWLD